MKKIILAFTATSILTLSAATAAPAFTSGAKVGFGVGYKKHSATQGLTLKTAPHGGGRVDETVSKTNSKGGINQQFHAGYDWVRGNLFMGLEGQYRHAPGKVTTNTFFKQAALNGAAFAGPDHKLTQSHKHDYALVANLGALVKENIAVYAIGSLRLGHFIHTSENFKNGLQLTPLGNGFSGKTTKKRWLPGAGVGAGVKWKATKGMSFGFEATYDMYKSMKTGDQFQGNTMDISTSAKKIRIFNAMLTTTWHF